MRPLHAQRPAWTLGVGLAAAGAIALAAVPAPASTPPPCATTATVAKLGSASPVPPVVQIIRSSGRAEPARRGSKLCDLDRLRTGFRSRATLDVRGHALVHVGGLSTLYLAGLTLDTPPELVLWLRAGQVTVAPVARGGSALRTRLVSPTATVTTTPGTSFQVFYEQVSPRETRVSSLGGVTRVTPTKGPFREARPNGLRRVVLQEGKEVVVSERAVTPTAVLGRAGVPAGWIPRSVARGAVEEILTRNHAPCRLTVHALTVRPGAEGWTVAAKLTARGTTSWAVWSFAGTRIRHANPFGTLASRGCR